MLELAGRLGNGWLNARPNAGEPCSNAPASRRVRHDVEPRAGRRSAAGDKSLIPAGEMKNVEASIGPHVLLEAARSTP